MSFKSICIVAIFLPYSFGESNFLIFKLKVEKYAHSILQSEQISAIKYYAVLFFMPQKLYR